MPSFLGRFIGKVAFDSVEGCRSLAAGQGFEMCLDQLREFNLIRHVRFSYGSPVRG